jgi:hypothetical protein
MFVISFFPLFTFWHLVYSGFEDQRFCFLFEVFAPYSFLYIYYSKEEGRPLYIYICISQGEGDLFMYIIVTGI